MKKKYKIDGETKEIEIVGEQDLEDSDELKDNKGEDDE